MIQKIDHINIVVMELEIVAAFFCDILGFREKDSNILEGEWIDKLVGLSGVSAKYIQLELAGSQTKLELIKYYSPQAESGLEVGAANSFGIRHIAFEVNNIEEIVARLKHEGVEFFSEIQTYNDSKKLCYFKGPENIILEFAEYKD